MADSIASKLTFYTDEDVNGLAITIARNLGVQIVTANDAGLLGADDPEHFAYALEHSCVLVMGNITDFIPMLRDWLAAGHDHPGIVFINSRHRQDSRLIAEELCIWYEAGTPDDMKNQTWWI